MATAIGASAQDISAYYYERMQALQAELAFTGGEYDMVVWVGHSGRLPETIWRGPGAPGADIGAESFLRLLKQAGVATKRLGVDPIVTAQFWEFRRSAGRSAQHERPDPS